MRAYRAGEGFHCLRLRSKSGHTYLFTFHASKFKELKDHVLGMVLNPQLSLHWYEAYALLETALEEIKKGDEQE